MYVWRYARLYDVFRFSVATFFYSFSCLFQPHQFSIKKKANLIMAFHRKYKQLTQMRKSQQVNNQNMSD